MGTRHLITVKVDGQVKIAQYGQWDGYPEGQGRTIYRFLTQHWRPTVFKEAVRACSWLSDTDAQLIANEYCKRKDGWMTLDEGKLFSADYPELSRDTGADILKIVQDRWTAARLTTRVRDHSQFKNDTLFCEYWYELDLDENTLSVYKSDYKEGVQKLMKKYSFLELPSEKDYIKELNKLTEEEYTD